MPPSEKQISLALHTHVLGIDEDTAPPFAVQHQVEDFPSQFREAAVGARLLVEEVPHPGLFEPPEKPADEMSGHRVAGS